MNRNLLWVACGVGVFVFLLACATMERTVVAPPHVPGAHFVGNASCVECHTNITRTFAFSAHGRFSKDNIKFAGVSGCESCHGPASEHIRVGGGGGRFIVNPGKKPDACFQCHVNVHSEFNLPQHHPVIEGHMNCVQCHDPHGHDIMKPTGGLAMARLNEQCAQCHREQSRPFVYEHEALREGCTTCHRPHGSINRQFLVERDNNLCLKCHLQIQGPDVLPGDFMIGKVSHANFIKRGSCWSAGCHEAVHGSNVNPHLLY
ncbi:MAG TPA: cytochrome c3 family protein [Verrucomicrobiae bacterium]|nr:cytochrome c3 family protein [Verrucomicrobiae bacterium]